MAKIAKMTAEKAADIAQKNDINFGVDYHTLSSRKVDILVNLAKAVGYRKPKSASGSTARYFFYYLKRKFFTPRNVDRLTINGRLAALKINGRRVV